MRLSINSSLQIYAREFRDEVYFQDKLQTVLQTVHFACLPLSKTNQPVLSKFILKKLNKFLHFMLIIIIIIVWTKTTLKNVSHSSISISLTENLIFKICSLRNKKVSKKKQRAVEKYKLSGQSKVYLTKIVRPSFQLQLWTLTRNKRDEQTDGDRDPTTFAICTINNWSMKRHYLYANKTQIEIPLDKQKKVFLLFLRCNNVRR